MAYADLLVALGIVAAILPSAPQQGAAPSAPADARYCLRVDPATGSRMETIRCETRDTWAQLGVDLDQEWGQWGVRIVAPGPLNS